ncbi:MAG: carbohydrate kinase family protein [Treponemataceae bacterium]|nr:carbohydrate kinase family protein [Treponemataceae bacterium]
MKQTLVIGSTVADIIIGIKNLPVSGSDTNTESHDIKLGGCAFNVSEVLRHISIPYLLCSPVGTGPYGEFVLKECKKKGIDCFHHVDEPNGCCYCFVEEGGERTFVSHHGAEYSFDPAWFESIDMSNVDSIYVCGLELEVDTEGKIVTWLENQKNVDIYFACSSRINFVNPEHVNRLLRLHPILHLSDKEAELYTGKMNPAESAEILSGYTDNTVIITSGVRGCYCRERQPDGAFVSIGVPAVNTVVKDTIGAGDAHIGAYIAYRKMGYSVSNAALLANTVSGAVVSISGANLSDEQFAALNIPVNITKK